MTEQFNMPQQKLWPVETHPRPGSPARNSVPWRGPTLKQEKCEEEEEAERSCYELTTDVLSPLSHLGG